MLLTPTSLIFLMVWFVLRYACMLYVPLFVVVAVEAGQALQRYRWRQKISKLNVGIDYKYLVPVYFTDVRDTTQNISNSFTFQVSTVPLRTYVGTLARGTIVWRFGVRRKQYI